MLDFSQYMDLPMVWAGLIALAVLMYVLLDGFDLGVGIIFPFAPSDRCRDRMMNSIAPFWDANETWLVLGGGGLFVAFPLAYAVLLPAFYLPIIGMLLSLVLRGVAFEFRFKAERARWLWDYVFHIGSLGAAFFQGVILGAFVRGVEANDRIFTGGELDWATGFSLLCGIAVVFGYALLGATWLVMKTEDVTQDWARRVAVYVSVYVAIFMAAVSLILPIVDLRIRKLWFAVPNIYWVLWIPLVTGGFFMRLWWDLLRHRGRECQPFFLSVGIFFMGYLGIIISIFPWIIPYRYDIWQAAASAPGLTLMLLGVIPLLPIILLYSGYSYYVFRGKSTHEKMY